MKIKPMTAESLWDALQDFHGTVYFVTADGAHQIPLQGLLSGFDDAGKPAVFILGGSTDVKVKR